MKEFEFINQFLKRGANNRPDVVLGIGDDCALVKPSSNQLLAVSTDTMVASVHFDDNASPASIGYKSLATSLSDLAAMGAEPVWVMLSLTLPTLDEYWCTSFCAGFFSLLQRYNLSLIGGNVSSGPLNITTQVFGFVPKNKALRRDSAQVGDLIYVTGTLGDAGLGLAWRQGKAQVATEMQAFITQRLDVPEPQIAAGLALRGIATSAIDVSDGLAGDLNHILEDSAVGATVYLKRLPLSSALTDSLTPQQQWNMALTAGGDYELCFTIPPSKRKKLLTLGKKLNCQFTRIGVIRKKRGLRFVDPTGNAYQPTGNGYEHFSQDN